KVRATCVRSKSCARVGVLPTNISPITTMERKGRRARKEANSRDTFGIIRAMNALIFVLGLTAVQAASSPAKIDIVSVTGCLKEATPNNWTLMSATDPVPSNANAPASKDIPAIPPAGKNEFRLIGVSEFNLRAHKDHT